MDVDCQAPLSMEFSRQEILEWLAISSSRGSSQPRDWTCVSWSSCIGRQILYHWTTREVPHSLVLQRVSMHARRTNTHDGFLCFFVSGSPTWLYLSITQQPTPGSQYAPKRFLCSIHDWILLVWEGATVYHILSPAVLQKNILCQSLREKKKLSQGKIGNKEGEEWEQRKRK